MLIALEGADGVGKATQAKMLIGRIREQRDAELYSFPRYDTPLGQAILRHLKGELQLKEADKFDVPNENYEGHYRQAPEDPLVFQCMMLADKADAAASIKKDLLRGCVVVCDRWAGSSIAYGSADGLNPAWLRAIHEGLGVKAAINIVLDVPDEEALRRRPERRDRYEKDREKQKVVREVYDHLCCVYPSIWIHVSGEGTPAEVHSRIWQTVSPLLAGSL